jgi:hypothetical protein
MKRIYHDLLFTPENQDELAVQIAEKLKNCHSEPYLAGGDLLFLGYKPRRHKKAGCKRV